MAIRYQNNVAGRPISTRARFMLTGGMMLAALVLGFAASMVLYQTNRDLMRQSDIVGYLLCGPGQHIDDVPVTSGRGRKMICRDPAGAEIEVRNNFVSVKMAMPFFILFAMPGLMLAWMVDWREVRRR